MKKTKCPFTLQWIDELWLFHIKYNIKYCTNNQRNIKEHHHVILLLVPKLVNLKKIKLKIQTIINMDNKIGHCEFSQMSHAVHILQIWKAMRCYV